MILLPLYTSYLPPNAYGQVEIVTAATAVLSIVLHLFAFSAVGYPKSAKMKYNPPAAIQ